jgi:hypothetical protein
MSRIRDSSEITQASCVSAIYSVDVSTNTALSSVFMERPRVHRSKVIPISPKPKVLLIWMSHRASDAVTTYVQEAPHLVTNVIKQVVYSCYTDPNVFLDKQNYRNCLFDKPGASAFLCTMETTGKCYQSPVFRISTVLRIHPIYEYSLLQP